MIGYIIFIIGIFMFFRNEYTSKRMNEARELIYEYVLKLSDEEYDFTRDYYQEMKMNYHRYMLSLHLWGKHSAIKPEYKETLLNH